MRAFSFLLPLTLLLVSACASTGSGSVDAVSEEAEIRSVLDAQQTAWNTGDIPGFMEGYWKSEDLRFASGGSITYGWQATLDRYLTIYDSPGKMGEVTFSDLVISVADEDDAMVFGKWELQREADRPWGLFTLHFRKIEGGWVIASDHTSSGG